MMGGTPPFVDNAGKVARPRLVRIQWLPARWCPRAGADPVAVLGAPTGHRPMEPAHAADADPADSRPWFQRKGAGNETLVLVAPAFMLSMAYGYLTTPRERGMQRLGKSVMDGVTDVAAPVVLMLGIGMLLAAAMHPRQAAVLTHHGAHHPDDAGGYVLFFLVASPLALYRGPLNEFGLGVESRTCCRTSCRRPPPWAPSSRWYAPGPDHHPECVGLRLPQARHQRAAVQVVRLQPGAGVLRPDPCRPTCSSGADGAPGKRKLPGCRGIRGVEPADIDGPLYLPGCWRGTSPTACAAPLPSGPATRPKHGACHRACGPWRSRLR